jgi:hypothetical protein
MQLANQAAGLICESREAALARSGVELGKKARPARSLVSFSGDQAAAGR